jgi:hypothetical protein
LKTFARFLTETIHPNLVEYLTQEIFKKKSLKQAAKSIQKKFNGTENWALGGPVEFTVDELIEAYYQDKATTLKAQLAKGDPAKADKATEMFAGYFGLDIDALKRYL